MPSWIKYFFGLTLFAMLLFYFLKKKSNTNAANTASKPTFRELQNILATASPKNNDYSTLAPYVFAQWQFETANFTSSLFDRANNASGMRIAAQREQKRTGETNGYAEYANWQQCAEDLVLWFDARRFPQNCDSLKSYVAECKQRSYFTADESKYYNGCLRYFNENN